MEIHFFPFSTFVKSKFGIDVEICFGGGFYTVSWVHTNSYNTTMLFSYSSPVVYSEIRYRVAPAIFVVQD